MNGELAKLLGRSDVARGTVQREVSIEQDGAAEVAIDEVTGDGAVGLDGESTEANKDHLSQLLGKGGAIGGIQGWTGERR